MNESLIPFNIPTHLNHRTTSQVMNQHLQGKVEEDQCDQLVKKMFGSQAFLTKSCTHSLEIIAKLIGFKGGDEVIVPSYAFPSLASAFVVAGANLVFADSGSDHPNIDLHEIERLITPRTRALVVVHYGGCACDMEQLLKLTREYNIILVEDAAHSIGTYVDNQHIGTLGDFGAISFHRTKNVSCEEGGLLLMNKLQNESFMNSLLDKGTNQKDFRKGMVESYQWVNLGSAYRLPSILSSMLVPQLRSLPMITEERIGQWENYFDGLKGLADQGFFQISPRPRWHNGHIFHLVLPSRRERSNFLKYLKQRGISAAFHYQSLCESMMAKRLGLSQILEHAHRYQEQLVRLPLFAGMNVESQERVINAIYEFYGISI